MFPRTPPKTPTTSSGPSAGMLAPVIKAMVEDLAFSITQRIGRSLDWRGPSTDPRLVSYISRIVMREPELAMEHAQLLKQVTPEERDEDPDLERMSQEVDYRLLKDRKALVAHLAV